MLTFQIADPGNMGIMSCLGRDLLSLSALLVSFSFSTTTTTTTTATTTPLSYC